MTVFRGNHPAKVDPKGRLKLPSGFKELMENAQVSQFFITSVDGKGAQIWPLPEWEKQEALLAESSTMDDAVEKYLNLTSYYGQQVEMDKEGRVLLPQILRSKAGLDAEVAIIGKLHYLEVYDHPLTAGDRETLKVILKPRS
jgi:MraZ protein